MVNIESFRKRFHQAKELRDVRWIDIANESGLNKAQISQYKNGVHEPEPDALYKLARALKVNAEWLMGHDVPMLESKTSKVESSILRRYEQLNEQGKAEFNRILSELSITDRFKK